MNGLINKIANSPVVTIGLILAGFVLMLWGIAAGEAAEVLDNAVIVCTECIGL